MQPKPCFTSTTFAGSAAVRDTCDGKGQGRVARSGRALCLDFVNRCAMLDKRAHHKLVDFLSFWCFRDFLHIPPFRVCKLPQTASKHRQQAVYEVVLMGNCRLWHQT